MPTLSVWVGPIFFLVGLLLLILVRNIERATGPSAASAAILTAVALHLGVALLSQTKAIVLLGLASVSWILMVYVTFRFRKGGIKRRERPLHPKDHCIVHLVYGENRDYLSPTKDAVASSWRYELRANFYCHPGQSSFWQWAWASGAIFYGYWLGWNTVLLNPTTTIICPEIHGKCHIDEDTDGDLSRIKSPISVSIANGIAKEDNIITIKTQIGAAINSSGGSNITGVVPLAAGETWITLQFPDCTDSITHSMGTWIWECVEGETVPKETSAASAE